MKRMLGTAVLFVLLILTIVGLQKFDTPTASAMNSQEVTSIYKQQ